jgi:hypothetical protein
VNLTRKQIEDSPKANEHQPVSRKFEQLFFQYYGLGYYWNGPDLWGQYDHPGELAAVNGDVYYLDATEHEIGESHLRSADEIISYGIHAQEYVVVDTRDWWPGGKKVMLSPRDLSEITWQDQSVSAQIKFDEIKKYPLFDPAKL